MHSSWTLACLLFLDRDISILPHNKALPSRRQTRFNLTHASTAEQFHRDNLSLSWPDNSACYHSSSSHVLKSEFELPMDLYYFLGCPINFLQVFIRIRLDGDKRHKQITTFLSIDINDPQQPRSYKRR